MQVEELERSWLAFYRLRVADIGLTGTCEMCRRNLALCKAKARIYARKRRPALARLFAVAISAHQRALWRLQLPSSPPKIRAGGGAGCEAAGGPYCRPDTRTEARRLFLTGTGYGVGVD